MQTSKRFELAVGKLYKAFHDGTLHPECNLSCAVGNICDNKESWKHFSDDHGSTQLNYIGLVNENLARKINGFYPSELLSIEAAFLKGCGYSLPFRHNGQRPKDPLDKHVLFNGLCAAITQICFLDGLEDVMDFNKLFDFKTVHLEKQLI